MPLEPRLRDGLQRAAEQVHPDVEGSLESVRRRADRSSSAVGGLAVAAALVVALVFVVQGLGSPGPQGPGTSASPAASGAAPPPGLPLQGTSWEVTLSDADPEAAALGMAGTWRLLLGADATVELTPPAGFRAPSGQPPTRYIHAVDEGSLTTNLFGRDFGASCAGAGTYRWRIDGDQLTLSGEDTCPARVALLTSATWTAAAP
jgi:hypothetical protein